MSVPTSIRRRVIERAKNRCEYCGLSQLGQAATFHVDHVTPLAAHGATTMSNLALACIHCSLRKGARIKAIDPRSKKTEPLFNPRQQEWNHHFRWSGTELIGITSVGRATLTVLALNSPEHQIIRSFESILGRHPPPGQK